MKQREHVLQQAEAAKARNLAYVPSDAYRGQAVMAADDGLLDRPATGNYVINARGERALAALRLARRG